MGLPSPKNHQLQFLWSHRHFSYSHIPIHIHNNSIRFVYFIYLQVSEPILAKTFHRKVQSKKIFIHRESFETIIANTEEKLAQVWILYSIHNNNHRSNTHRVHSWKLIEKNSGRAHEHLNNDTFRPAEVPGIEFIDLTKWFGTKEEKKFDSAFQWIGIYCVIIRYHLI